MLNRLAPVSRKELIKRLAKLGFEGPYVGSGHEYMIWGALRVKLPNVHRSQDISVDLLARILRDAEISREEWFSAA